MAQIDTLLAEANALPRATSTWERRQEIDWELIQLFRKIAAISAGPRPYWSHPASETDAQSIEDISTTRST